MYGCVPVSFAIGAVFLLIPALNSKVGGRAAKKETAEAFLDFLICLMPVLEASRTFPDAFKKAVLDYERIHGKNHFHGIAASTSMKFDINISSRDAMREFAAKADIEDAYIFAQSIAVCEETGGDIKRVTGRTIRILTGKMRTEQKIGVLFAGKIVERKIVTAAPFILMVVLRLTGESYLEPLYSTTMGRVVMTFAGILLAAEWYLGGKVMEIEV
jgi:tight adherence protein B